MIANVAPNGKLWFPRGHDDQSVCSNLLALRSNSADLAWCRTVPSNTNNHMSNPRNSCRLTNCLVRWQRNLEVPAKFAFPEEDAQKIRPLDMANCGICNTSPRCTDKFHKQLFDILRHINLLQKHAPHKSFPLVLVQVCLYQEHSAHQIVSQRELCTMSLFAKR